MAMPALILAFLGSAPCPGMPLSPGTSWTYRAEVAYVGAKGDSVRHHSLSWTATVLTVQASESAVAATVRGWPSDLAWWKPGDLPETSVLYCVAGRVYHFAPLLGTAGALADSLLSGRRRPSSDELVLQLPLRTGQLFGRDPNERRDTFYAWFVEATEPVPPAVRRLHAGSGDSLYSVVYRTNPDFTLVGFVPGLGVAHYVYSHHGTTAEADAWLVAYREGAAFAIPAFGQELVAVAKRVSVASLDSTFPAVPFEKWLADLRGVPVSAITWEVNDCGEGGDGREAPTCVEAILSVTADTTAHASLVVAGIDGKRLKPAIWDLSVGAGYSFTGFKTLREWAAYLRTHRD